MSTGRSYHGVFLATVVATDDPDELGRIRLDADQFSDTSDDPLWATVVRPLAGDGPTVFFTPKEGDQVVISFLAGNPRDPVVLGYAHNTQRKPEEVSETKHAIVTRAGRVTFDEDGSIEVELASGNTSIKLDSDGIHLAHENVTMDLLAGGIEVKGNEPFTIDGETVVLAPFLSRFYLRHTHTIGSTTTNAPVPPPPMPNDGTTSDGAP